MTSSPARLNIPSHTPIDDMDEYPNPDGRGEVQISSGGRSTEIEAELRMQWGDLIAATNNGKTYNGEFVDLDTQLYCTACQRYHYDNQFDKDARNQSRRGRRYVCKAQRAGKEVYAIMDDELRRKVAGKGKRRKRK